MNGTGKTLSWILIILILIGVALFGWFIYQKIQNPNQSDVTDESKNYFPFGNNGTKQNPTQNTTTEPSKETGTGSTTTGEEQTPIVESKLKQLTKGPVAGYGLMTKEIPIPTPPAPEGTPQLPPANTTTKNSKAKKPLTQSIRFIRYTLQTNGNISEINLSSYENTLLSNTTILGVHESFFGNNGSRVVMRYLRDDDQTIETAWGDVPTGPQVGDTGSAASGMAFVPSFLPLNISLFTPSPSTLQAIYQLPFDNQQIFIVSDMLGKTKRQIYASPFMSWISSWVNQNLISITTKASGYAPGYMYTIDLTKQSPTPVRILGEIYGLTTLMSPDGTYVLYGSNDGGRLHMRLYTVKDRTSVELSPASIPSDKCAWNSGSDIVICAAPKTTGVGVYPDAWYQGTTRWTDSLWEFNTKTGLSTQLNDLPGGIDATNVAFDAATNRIFFINRQDGSLWQFQL